MTDNHDPFMVKMKYVGKTYSGHGMTWTILDMRYDPNIWNTLKQEDGDWMALYKMDGKIVWGIFVPPAEEMC